MGLRASPDGGQAGKSHRPARSSTETIKGHDMQITIINTAIRQDEHGRYSHNDLHRAAGGEKRHQPANFMRADGVEAFIAELDSTPQNRGVPSVSTLTSSPP